MKKFLVLIEAEHVELLPGDIYETFEYQPEPNMWKDSTGDDYGFASVRDVIGDWINQPPAQPRGAA